jgi:hypothetical protein
MGNMQRSQSDSSRYRGEYVYKNDPITRFTEEHTTRPSLLYLPRWVVSIAVGTMVLTRFLAKALLAVAPLTSVCAQYSAPSSLPLLLDATTEELTLGLEAGNFTSVDLVNVSFVPSHFLI